MSFSDYTGLKAALADWINRADLTAQIPDFITLAEATLNKVVRNTRMVARTTVSVAANASLVAAPGDLLEVVYGQVTGSATYPLEQVSVEQLVALRRARMRSAGTPRYFALVGGNIEVAPSPAVVTSLTLAYYQQIPALSASNATNWVLEDHPDLYLYTALLHAQPFLKDDQRAALFSSMLAQQVAALVKQNATATFDGVRTSGFSVDGKPPAAPVTQASQ